MAESGSQIQKEAFSTLAGITSARRVGSAAMAVPTGVNLTEQDSGAGRGSGIQESQRPAVQPGYRADDILELKYLEIAGCSANKAIELLLPAARRNIWKGSL